MTSAVLDAFAAAFAVASALVSSGLTPLWEPASVRVLTNVMAIGLACVALQPRRALAVTMVIVAGAASGLAPSVISAGSLVLTAALARRALVERPALLTGIAAAIVAFVVASLRRSFDPGILDVPGAALVDALAPGTPAPMAAERMGASLLPIGAAAALAGRASVWRRALAAVAVLAASILARYEGDPWYVVAAVAASPAIASWGAESRRDERSRRAAPFLRVGSPVAAVVAALSLALVTSAATRPAAGPGLVGFVGAMHGSFEPEPRPTPHSFSSDNPPRFGRLRALLERQGTRTTLLASADSRDLEACTSFVTINFSGPEAASFVEPVRRRVARGARLVVLADHTDMFGQQKPTHDLLAGTGIRLAFDSAVPRGTTSAWQGAMEVGRDPLFGAHPMGRGITWSVGCSLDVEPPARALAWGTRAFADAGDRRRPGGLGDLRFQENEAVGGFALAAASRIEKGSVLVFGDTSAVQDGALEEGHAFVERLGSWLGGVEPASSVGARSWLAFASLVLVLAAAAFLGDGPRWLLLLAAVPAVGDGIAERSTARAGEAPERGDAWIRVGATDMPGFRVHGDPGRRIQPIFQDAMLRGRAARLDLEGASLRSSDVWIRVDPARPMKASELSDHLAFLESGGKLVLFLGPRGALALHPLLSAFGVAVGAPLGGSVETSWEGRARSDVGEPPFFRSCHEVAGAEAAGLEVLARAFDRPVAVAGTSGGGSWLLIADAELPLSGHSDVELGGTLAGAATLHRLLDAALGPIRERG